MKRFCLSRRQFTPKEADQRIQNCFQMITVHADNINYWIPKIRKSLDFMDSFILGVDRIKSPAEFIKLSNQEIDFLRRKIYEDYGRYVRVKNTCG